MKKLFAILWGLVIMIGMSWPAAASPPAADHAILIAINSTTKTSAPAGAGDQTRSTPAAATLANVNYINSVIGVGCQGAMASTSVGQALMTSYQSASGQTAYPLLL